MEKETREKKETDGMRVQTVILVPAVVNGEPQRQAVNVLTCHVNQALAMTEKGTLESKEKIGLRDLIVIYANAVVSLEHKSQGKCSRMPCQSYSCHDMKGTKRQDGEHWNEKHGSNVCKCSCDRQTRTLDCEC